MSYGFYAFFEGNLASSMRPRPFLIFMETIHKKIAIEPFRCRIVNRHNEQEMAIKNSYPYFTIGTGENSLEYAYDIKVNDEELKEILPLSKDDVLRYGAFREYYYLCIDFEKNAKVYKKCANGKWRKESDITRETDLPIYPSIDDIDENFNGDRVIIYNEADYLKGKFVRKETLCHDIFAVSDFCKKCFGNSNIKKEVPYADVSVYLSSEINDQGRIEYAIPKWAGGKEYEKGQYVIYGGSIYRAERNIEIKAKTDGTFEKPTDDGSGWKKVEQVPISSEPVTVTGISEQRSTMFLSKKKYIEEKRDENGKLIITEYPFYEDGGKFYFPYIKRKIGIGDGAARLERIRFNGMEEIRGENIVVYPFESIFKNYGDVITSVTFNFSLYDEHEGENVTDWDDAVKYEETYHTTTTATTSGIKYFFIETGDTQTVSNFNSDLTKEERNVNFAAVSYTVNKEKYDEDEIEKLNFFIKISPTGSQDIKMDIDADIDRGSCALFEKMNILGEVKSIRDLEKYRNNYFDI